MVTFVALTTLPFFSYMSQCWKYSLSYVQGRYSYFLSKQQDNGYLSVVSRPKLRTVVFCNFPIAAESLLDRNIVVYNIFFNTEKMGSINEIFKFLLQYRVFSLVMGILMCLVAGIFFLKIFNIEKSI